MPDTTTRSILFAFGLCIVCSLLLTSAATGLKTRQEANVVLDRQTNILRAAGLIALGTVPDRNRVPKQFAKRIRTVSVDPTTARPVSTPSPESLDFYIRVGEKGQDVEGYVIPVISRGLWGKIYGFIALGADGNTVTGFTVYSHQETPGLGGEIEQPWFQKNFIGKKITDPQGRFEGIRIAKGKAADQVASHLANTVDGISGATLTGKYLTGGLVDLLQRYEPVARTFRDGLSARYLETS